MSQQDRDILGRIWRGAWRPPDRRPPWAWCEDNVISIPYSPIPGRFRSDNSPWVRAPMEVLADPRIRVVSIIAAIQSGKTSVGELSAGIRTTWSRLRAFRSSMSGRNAEHSLGLLAAGLTA